MSGVLRQIGALLGCYGSLRCNGALVNYGSNVL